MRDVESSDGAAVEAGIEFVAQPIPTRLGLGRPVWGVRGRWVAGVVALAVAYYAAAKLGYALEFSGPVAAIVWLPAGVAIAFLSLGGLRFWPGVLMGDLLANDYARYRSARARPDAGEHARGARGRAPDPPPLARGSPLDSLGGIALLLAAVAAGTAISATVGPLSLSAGGVISTATCWSWHAPGGSATPRR